jgi:hypothetical protein
MPILAFPLTTVLTVGSGEPIVVSTVRLVVCLKHSFKSSGCSRAHKRLELTHREVTLLPHAYAGVLHGDDTMSLGTEGLSGV